MRAFLRDLGQASLFLLAIFLGSVLGSLLFFYLPVIPVLTNPREIVSPLTALNFAPVNNVIRFGLYLLSPILFFLLLRPLRARLAHPSPESFPELYSAKSAWMLTQVFFLASSLALLGIATFLDTREINDFWFFHEGEWLAPAWKWLQTGQIWRGSFFAHGAFYDALGSGLAWKIFSVTNIAASRVMTSFLEKVVYLPLMATMVTCAHFTYAVKSRYAAAIFFRARDAHGFLSHPGAMAAL
ncbi:MAG: hypothetical protein AB7K68_12350 [Bacteriovoracia bacterium]